MFAELRSAVRTATKRLGADPFVVVAAALTIFLAAVLLASGPIYAEAITTSVLERRLSDAPVTEANVEVEVDVFPGSLDAVDVLVRHAARHAFAGTGVSVFSHIASESYGLSSARPNGSVELVSFEVFESIENQAGLVAGDWPGQSSGGEVEVAVNEPAALALGLAVGDRETATNARDSSFVVPIVVTGIFRQNEPGAPYWMEEELTRSGVVETGGFRTYGPFVVSLRDMRDALSPGRVRAGWHLLADFGGIDVSEVDRIRGRVDVLASDLDRDAVAATGSTGAGLSTFSVTTGLPNLLSTVNRSLVVTRSSILALLIQLSLLAGYGLVLSAGLLADARRAETDLLRSRGMSPGQIVGVSLVEGVILTVAAVFAAPWASAILLRALNHIGPLAAVGLRIEPHPGPEAYMLATIAAGASIVALVWPAWRSARAFGRGSHRDRESARSGFQGVGVDVALLVVAAVLIWQLVELGPQVAARVRGRSGFDPILIAAPALGLLAGAVLALRVVPLLARVGEWVITSRGSTVAALASWQVARRPLRYARSALLLMMAVGVGLFAATFTSTWSAAQADRAAHAVGSDFAVIPDRSTGGLADLFLRPRQRAVAGVEESMPVIKVTGRGSAGTGVQFLILDAAKAEEVVAIRSDLGADFGEAMSRLVEGRPVLPAVPLPGEPARLRFLMAAEEQPTETPQGALLAPIFTARLRATIQDGDDLLHRLDAGEITAAGSPQVVDVALQSEDSTSGLSTPTFPLRLIDVEIETRMAGDLSRRVSLRLGEFELVDAQGIHPLSIQADERSWEAKVDEVGGAHVFPSISSAGSTDAGWLDWNLETGVGAPDVAVYIAISPHGPTLPADLPLVVSEEFATQAFAASGDEISLSPLRMPEVAGLIVGQVSAVPALDPELGEGVILDLPSYQMLRRGAGSPLPQAEEYWLSGSGDPEITATELTEPPLNSFEVISRAVLEDELISDPVALGVIGALFVGFIAATTFAAAGLAANALISARERGSEFALLRAVGLSPRQVGGWLILEQGLLVGVSMTLGTLIGIVVTAVILPLTALTSEGGQAVPSLLVVYPWKLLIIMGIVVVVVVMASVLMMTRFVGGLGLASALRVGEE